MHATLRMSGRIQPNHIAAIRSEINDGCTRKVVESTEVIVLDIAVDRFLI
jgi:hypothetical protein